ncbi:MAG TPA: exodeoxyribonuclease VII small subunit [Gemmatimonadaceae bacterium]|nr:exodeoxyribonuclease VII small subunit [Gemmatimonadaceae bacterium]
MPYEADLRRIEDIVAALEHDDLDLDQALALFNEGVQRLKSAAATLAEAEGQVRVLTEDEDGGFALAKLTAG